MQKETAFKKRAQRDLRTIPGIWFFKTQEVCVRGIPDLIICLRGLFIAIELKKDEKSKPTELQKHILGLIEKAQGLAFVATPENWESILRILRGIGAASDSAQGRLKS